MCKILKKECNWTSKWAMVLIRLLGWKINNITHPTALKKAVVVLAPHTTNWDFLYSILFKFSYPTVAFKFAIKKEVMFFPLSYVMRALGAIPIDRSKTTPNKGHNMASVMANTLNAADTLLLVIPPEGTRKYVKRWKTGFYRIAEAGNVPIMLGYINYATKEMGLGPIFYPTGNMNKDIADIQNFYIKIPGKYPEKGVI
ncbi:1-acyl-sn-glycerol-3-phosphate acyltransferase [Candidatus Cardinium hertigii]|uniref:Glycerol acyltransferase n=1 Tax=Candidatus Cardinium hertigii TaxID=247481 RepID=A0A3N2QB31_9BACT|nr:1-acyl-sn-glycerol-3-phosphate acyltransferase [Candidatus Cardinium hertigii]ROT47005.1 glycerol acyltransferase [Candidatus Cardinium hertigii]